MPNIHGADGFAGETEPSAPVRLGDRYELGGVLGEGGTAQVHRGVDLVLGRAVAIKVFRSDVEFHDSARVRDEGRTLAALNHSGLVTVYDAGTAETPGGVVHYLVMELIEGPSLATAACDGSLLPTDVALVGAQIGNAMAYVHGQGMIHRDIKPANILIDQDGQAKITDFGIARLVDSARRTATGVTIGTAAYLSPEQLTGAEVGPASDVYSLGLVLLECLTGRREYPGTGIESALARLHRSPQIPVSLPQPWPGLLAAMTDSDPSRRPSAADVATALALAPEGDASGWRQGEVAATTAFTSMLPTTPQVADTAAMTAPNSGSRVRPGTSSRRAVPVGRGLIGAIAVVVASAIVLTGVMLGRGGGPKPQPSSGPTSSSSVFARDLNDLKAAVTP